jgi:hypothetical protein
MEIRSRDGPLKGLNGNGFKMFHIVLLFDFFGVGFVLEVRSTSIYRSDLSDFSYVVLV